MNLEQFVEKLLGRKNDDKHLVKRCNKGEIEEVVNALLSLEDEVQKHMRTPIEKLVFDGFKIIAMITDEHAMVIEYFRLLVQVAVAFEPDILDKWQQKAAELESQGVDQDLVERYRNTSISIIALKADALVQEVCMKIFDKIARLASQDSRSSILYDSDSSK